MYINTSIVTLCVYNTFTLLIRVYKHVFCCVYEYVYCYAVYIQSGAGLKVNIAGVIPEAMLSQMSYTWV
jgi:hypothetical protein